MRVRVRVSEAARDHLDALDAMQGAIRVNTAAAAAAAAVWLAPADAGCGAWPERGSYI